MTALPGSALGAVNGTGPFVRHIGAAVSAATLNELGWQQGGAPIIDPDREAVLVDALDGGAGAIDQTATPATAGGVQQHPIAGPVLPLGAPSRPYQRRARQHPG